MSKILRPKLNNFKSNTTDRPSTDTVFEDIIQCICSGLFDCRDILCEDAQNLKTKLNFEK